ncbi:uncharacterized protein LOC116926910 isoform X2 [Daphnia magna]|uniref:uncharacterized protein LOC116926910 isoform X2 n=1 Tax=Daphnia magna TaxID=35525 RepID=UPI001E1BC339|nr:uncharacterized protein LOC116926910 isoform X2 [Daphnia magna]
MGSSFQTTMLGYLRTLLGEVCNHVAGLLQVCMVSSQINEQISCTEQLCTWSGTYSKPDVFKKITDMGAVCMEKLPKINVPSKEDITLLLSKLEEMPGKPTGILLVTDNSKNFIHPALTITLPKPIGSMFKMDLMGCSLTQLVEKSNELYSQISISFEQREAISSLTLNQSDSKNWFRYTAYRITASKFKCVLKTSIEKPSISLIKEICYLEAFKFTSEATSWGLKKESVALEAFEENLNHINEHPGFTLSRAGALISTAFPFLAASPDAIFSCPCHGSGVIEIKCPFKFKNGLISTAAKTKGFPLIYNEETRMYSMDQDHAYYFQVQLQLCFFCGLYRFGSGL